VSEDESAFPTLDAADIEVFDGLGTRRPVREGEYLYRSGDPVYDFFVMVSGAVDIIVHADGEERMVARHVAGRFLGELNLLTGSRVLVSARVTEPGEVIAVPRDELRRLVATNPRLSDMILTAFLARRAVLLDGAASAIRLVGSRFSPETGPVREFLSRTRIPHEWLDPDRDADVEGLLEGLGLSASDLPVVIAPGAVLRRPTPGDVADWLGITVGNLPGRCFDLVVVGGGPAGLAAAVYGASEGLRTLGLDMTAVGGQAATSSRIENYLGFPTGISGGDLAQRALVQAEKFGAYLTSPCAATSLREEAGHLVVHLSDGTDVAARAVIVATGARYRRLEAERIEDFEGTGVYYACTELEARQCGASSVVVVGGGNSAGQAAVFLADNGGEVTVVIRGPSLADSMSRYLVDRIDGHPRISLRTNTVIKALEGGEILDGLRVAGTEGEEVLGCAALFSFIGADPASEWLSGCAALDSKGFVLTDRALDDDQLDGRWDELGRSPLPFETNHPGLFAVGDIRSGSTKRVAAAVGEGSAAVRSVHEFLAFDH
jgi:thioredoxin reductase (NADPH)